MVAVLEKNLSCADKEIWHHNTIDKMNGNLFMLKSLFYAGGVKS